MEYCDETLASRLQGPAGSQVNPELFAMPIASKADPGADGRAGQSLWYQTIMAPDSDGPATSTGMESVSSDLDWETVINIVGDILSALIYIHAEKVVHRDLKPANGTLSRHLFLLLVLFSKKDNCWKIADFGTASHATSKRLNTTRDARGTAGYRAPETLHSEDAKFNQKSDIFALGCILYEIVTGQKLFPDDWASVSYSKTRKLPNSVWWPESPSCEPNRLTALEVLVASMLEVDPSSRPNAREIYSTLNLIRIGDCEVPLSNPSSTVPVEVYRRSFSS